MATIRPPHNHAVIQIWLNREDPPPHVQRWMDLWRAHSPAGYRLLNLYDAASMIPTDRMKWAGERYKIESRDWYRTVSDMLRYEYLWRFGGFYVDVDTEPLKAGILSELMLYVNRHEHEGAVFVGHPSRNTTKYVCNGILYFPWPYHSLMEVMREVPLDLNRTDVDHQTGPFVLTGEYEKHSVLRMLSPYVLRDGTKETAENLSNCRILLHQGWFRG